MKKLLATLPLLTLVGMQTVQADTIQAYNIVETFYEPMETPKATVFTGSFLYDVTTGTISALSGNLSESMTGTSQSTESLVALSYQLATTLVSTAGVVSFGSGTQESDGNGGLLASTYGNNNTTVFLAGSDKKTAGTSNAYTTIDVVFNSATNSLNASSSLTELSYADCTIYGMMGTTCMTGNATLTGGSMHATPLSEVLTETNANVPEPATLPLIATGFAAFGAYRRKKLSPD